MKRIIALILALVIVLGMTGCGSKASDAELETEPTPEQAEESTPEQTVESTPEQAVEPTPEPALETGWELAYYLDDFGDPTNEAYLRSKPISGTFSNTATLNSSLTVILFFNPYFSDPSCYTLNDDGYISKVTGDGASTLAFRLLEYDESKAVYSSNEDIVLKMKIGDKTSSTTLYGQSPNADPYLLGYEHGPALEANVPIYDFISALIDDKEIKCVIEIGSSRYNFTVDGAGFLEQYRELYKAYGIKPRD